VVVVVVEGDFRAFHYTVYLSCFDSQIPSSAGRNGQELSIDGEGDVIEEDTALVLAQAHKVLTLAGVVVQVIQ
jgi:hypothetical protein